VGDAHKNKEKGNKKGTIMHSELWRAVTVISMTNIGKNGWRDTVHTLFKVSFGNFDTVMKAGTGGTRFVPCSRATTQGTDTVHHDPLSHKPLTTHKMEKNA
jgi:hypothetical protein